MSVIELWLLSMVVVFLFGCEERFRYPCQNPKNWDTPECKAPLCTATGTCPDQLVKPEQEKK